MSEELTDKILFDKETRRARDTDKDDSNDEAELKPLESSDLREAINLERETVIDVLSGLPEGRSIDQTLGKGLDGKPIGKSTNHLGNADAEGMLAGRGVDANSPLNMTRGAVTGNATPPASGGTGPSDADLNFQAPNMSLYGESDGGTPDPHAPPMTAEEKVKARESNKENREREKWEKEQAKKKEEGKNVDPDADTGGAGGPISVEQVERAILLKGTDTDFVPGAGVHIDVDSPPKNKLDPVTDPGDEDPGAVAGGTGKIAPPGSEISRPVNPQDGIGGGGPRPTPGAGPGQGGGGQGGGGEGGGGGPMNMATGAATIGNGNVVGSGIQSAGGDNTGGIQSISEFDAEMAVTSDLELALDDLMDEPFAQRSADDGDLVSFEPVPDDGV